MEIFEAGNYVDQGRYSAFIPTSIHRQWILNDPELLNLLGQANRELGRLDMFSEFVPNISLFISLHVTKEATKSSKIEGTQTNIEDFFMGEEGLDQEQRLDRQEVKNYIDSLFFSIDQLSKIPLSSRLIRQSHKILLSGVRGKHKSPGKFRTSQNWIGGASIADAAFIPPPHQQVPSLMADLEKFFHDTKFPIPHLIKVAIGHYQFETIHPFLDGNGRVGRLLIPLYLAEKEILKQPVLYLSDYLEKHRHLYYDHLSNVRRTSNILPWLKFFLVGIIETAKNGIATFEAILNLQKKIDLQLMTLGKRTASARKLITQLYQSPITNSTSAATVLGLSPPPVHRLLKDFENMGVLVEITGNERNREFLFKEYLDLFRN